VVWLLEVGGLWRRPVVGQRVVALVFVLRGQRGEGSFACDIAMERPHKGRRSVPKAAPRKVWGRDQS
jgi:predicted hotdog family 3-hydroxylacyl-ACP dehydratase